MAMEDDNLLEDQASVVYDCLQLPMQILINMFL